MTPVAYAHPAISRFAIADGMLHIGGLPVGLLAERAGATPFFAYERTEAGGYVTRAADRKESRGHTFLVVDGGRHHQLAAPGNFGQVIRKNYPVAIANRMGVPGAETVSVVGCLCTPLDLPARACLPPACRDRRPCGGPSGRRLRNDGQFHSVPPPCDTDGPVGADRGPPDLHDR